MSSGTFGLGPFTPIHPAVDWMSLMCACIYSETVMTVINFVAVSISHAVIATAELVGGACRFILVEYPNGSGCMSCNTLHWCPIIKMRLLLSVWSCIFWPKGSVPLARSIIAFFILPGRQQCACSTSLISSRIHH